MLGARSLVLFEDMLADGAAGSRLYGPLLGSVGCARGGDPAAFFEQIEAWHRAELPVVLLLDYEFGELLDAAAGRIAPGTRADVAQALAFESVLAGSSQDAERWIDQQLAARGADTAPAGVAGLEPAITWNEYERRFAQVQQFIRDGHTYQINLTFPLYLRWFGDPLALYRQLRARQRVSYGAFVELADRTIVSLSPELFLERRGDLIQTRPMKGTRPRVGNPQRDRQSAEQMRADPKSRAENLMIVDLLRNDLGRVCEIGSVRVRSLFDIETFDTVLQMTSTVQGRLSSEVGLESILRALFPCGSVTGAPKHRSRQIIAQLEQRARGIYTGSIGTLDPDGHLRLNVAIRTLELDGNGRGMLGIGGGVVADSTAQDEWNECFVKARFLTQTDPGFELIETLRADLPAGGSRQPAPTLSAWVELWRKHLARLLGSAAYFGFRADPDQIGSALKHALEGLPAGVHRVRLSLNKAGAVQISSEPLGPEPSTIPAVRIAPATVLSDAWHQAHKTTYRPLYDPGLQIALSEGLWDVLFFNQRDELVEGARSSVFVRVKGQLVTPPLASGALPGLMRARLLADRSTGAVERPVLRHELAQAQAVYLCNAVRGLFQVRLS